MRSKADRQEEHHRNNTMRNRHNVLEDLLKAARREFRTVEYDDTQTVKPKVGFEGSRPVINTDTYDPMRPNGVDPIGFINSPHVGNGGGPPIESHSSRN